jgi:type IV pilus assembly protein PilC
MKLKIYYQKDNQIKTIAINTTKNYVLPKNIIKIKPLKTMNDYLYTPFLYSDEIVELFNELNIMLNTHLSFDEAINILLESSSNNKRSEILLTIKLALENAQSFKTTLEKHKNFLGELPIVFLDMGINNANIQQSVNALSIILTNIQKTKKSFLSALWYPTILIITLLIAFISILTFVIPQFDSLFTQYGDNLPLATSSLLFIRYIFVHYYFLMILAISSLIVLLIYIYKKYRLKVDKIFILHIPLFSKVYRYFEVYKFLLSLYTLMKSNYPLQVSIHNAKLIVTNTYLIMKIEQIMQDLKNGISIHCAFKNTNVFDIMTIRLLMISEKSNTLIIILKDIVLVHKKHLDSYIKYFSASIGPSLILLIAGFVLWLVFALMLPMWDLGSVLNK